MPLVKVETEPNITTRTTRKAHTYPDVLIIDEFDIPFPNQESKSQISYEKPTLSTKFKPTTSSQPTTSTQPTTSSQPTTSTQPYHLYTTITYF